MSTLLSGHELAFNKPKQKGQMIPVTISRRIWSRGRLSRNALLIDQVVVGECKDLSESEYTARPTPKLGGKCCLGFVCNALGVSDEAIAGLGMPELLRGEDREKVKSTMLRTADPMDCLSGAPDTDGYIHRRWVTDAQHVNDSGIEEFIGINHNEILDDRKHLESEAHREWLITKLFAIGGLEAIFVE